MINKNKKMKQKTEHKNRIILGISLAIVIILLVSLLSSLIRINNLKDKMDIIANTYEDEIDSLNTVHIEKMASMSAIDYTPTLSEVKNVIRNTYIENKKYDDETFNCVEFSNNLVRAFKEAKIYACVTELWFDDGGAHALVAINIEDRGVIYIEPQDDEIIYDLKVGDDYCDKVNWDCEWEITHIKSCYV